MGVHILLMVKICLWSGVKGPDQIYFKKLRRVHVTSHPTLFGHRREKTCLRGFANNTGADQPAHPRSLISTFVIRFLESATFNLATGEISFF